MRMRRLDASRTLMSADAGSPSGRPQLLNYSAYLQSIDRSRTLGALFQAPCHV